MEKPRDSCVEPAKGPIGLSSPEASEPEGQRREEKVIAKVGKEASDFEAPAYVDGGFKNIKLSDYRGKWVVLCFYPGDFTFV